MCVLAARVRARACTNRYVPCQSQSKNRGIGAMMKCGCLRDLAGMRYEGKDRQTSQIPAESEAESGRKAWGNNTQ